MIEAGTPSYPLRVAIIGSGPSGFYAADHLQKQSELTIEIDMFDRLPTPFGLVRGGVAPDHQKIKSVTKLYDRIASHDNFHFYGNVEFGRDLSRQDLSEHYHAIIYAVGAQTDRSLDIDGEDLAGSHPATEFVAWYNAHPDFRDKEFDLSQKKVAVIGVGNVAIDVVRILARSRAELYETDIADYALEALSQSNIEEIYIIGRRGPVQASFTTPELKELGEMEEAEVIIEPSELELDDLSADFLDKTTERTVHQNMKIMRQLSEGEPQGRKKKIIFRFLASPVEILGEEKVEGLRIVKNELYHDQKRDRLNSRATDETEVLDVGLIFRSVGYRGVPLPDVPFYDSWGIIPNVKGRVIKEFGSEETVIGSYVVGWIKRGPSGIIGTNKPDSVETVKALLEDLNEGNLHEPECPIRAEMENLLRNRGVRYVTFEDWQKLDQIEQERGIAVNRPRVKFSTVAEMLEALDSPT